MYRTLLFLAAIGLSSCASLPDARVVFHSTDISSGEDGEKLVLATYNVFGLRDTKNLKRTFEELDFVDVWALQEVNVPAGEYSNLFLEASAPSALDDVLPEGNWDVFFVPLNLVGDDDEEVEGLAIASRRPLRDRQIWRLKASADGDPGGKRRAALAARISASGTSILIVNTDHEVGWLRITPSDRQLQVDSILENISSGKKSIGTPVVLMGDFNCSGRPLTPWLKPISSEIRDLRASLLSVGLGRLPGQPDTVDTFRKLIWSQPIDHIFKRGLLCTRWGTVGSYSGSDHRPLWAEFAVASSKASQ